MSFLEIVMQLGDSTLQTLLIFALTLLFSIPLGVLICAMHGNRCSGFHDCISRFFVARR